MTTQPTVNYSTWALRGDDQANWYESYANRSVFELCDAAYILANVQPEYPASLDRDCLDTIDHWNEVLKANIHELLAPSGYNEKQPLHHRLSHQKLRAWCKNANTVWPIPERREDRIAALEQELAEERQLRIKAQHIADPVMSPFVHQDYCLTEPPVLKFGEPDEVYRHLDYLTADQALDWMKRISGYHVEWETLWALVSFEMCDAFMDCRAVRGLTYAAEGEHAHRVVFGLGLCQVMNAAREAGSPLHVLGPAIHVDIHGFQEIVPKRSWWINDPQDYNVFFRPSDIERMGGIVNDRGGWSSIEPVQADETPTECNGAELAHQLGKLQISISNLDDRLSYCVRFEDGRFLAELGSDLKPLRTAPDIAQQAGASYDKHDSEVAELRELVIAQREQLQSLQQPSSTTGDGSSTGITFPYSTKGLEALRAVALKQWADYTPEKRQPTQKEIGYAICEALGVKYQKTNEPPRKAKELATIIRPDDLPEL